VQKTPNISFSAIIIEDPVPPQPKSHQQKSHQIESKVEEILDDDNSEIIANTDENLSDEDLDDELEEELKDLN
jgi:hypothetical protein